MKCATPKKQMKAREGKITFFEKHKLHSKTLRKKKTDAKTRLECIQYENAFKNISRRRKHLCYLGNFFFPLRNIQHAIVPCQMTHTTMKVYNQQENVSFNMFNNNEAIEPK